MRKITQDNDLILVPDLRDCKGNQIPFTAFTLVEYTLYTKEDEYTLKVTTADSDDGDTISFIDEKIYIPSTIMAKFSKGILRFNIHLAIKDDNFSDGNHDIVYHKQNTNIYIEG